MRGVVKGGAKTAIASVAALADPQFEDRDARVGTKYYYQVSAINADGEGPRTGELGAEPFPAAGYPDLHVRSIEIIPPEPSPGSRVVVRVLVDNIGRDPAPSALVRLQMDGVLMTERYTPVLFPRGDTVVESSSIVGAGAHTISAYVDPANKVLEPDEVNNYLLRTFIVPQGEITEPGEMPWAGFAVAVVAGAGIAYVAYTFTRKEGGRPPTVVRAATPPARGRRR